MNTAAIEERLRGRSSRQPGFVRSIPYVVPFVVFFILLLSSDYLHGVFGEWEYPFRVTVLALVLYVFSRACHRPASEANRCRAGGWGGCVCDLGGAGCADSRDTAIIGFSRTRSPDPAQFYP